MHECSEDIYIPKAYWYDLLSFLDSSLDYNSIIVDINADVSMDEHYIVSNKFVIWPVSLIVIDNL